MSITPRSQIRLAAVTGSLTAISDIANQSLSAQSRLEPQGAETIGATNLEGILGQLAASIKRVQGDENKDFTEVQAGVFTHATSQFIGVLSASSDLKTGGDLTIRGASYMTGSVQMNANLDVDGLATLAGAKVEDLNVAGGMVFTDATGRLDNDSKVVWNGSQLGVTGNVSGSGNLLVGGNSTIAGNEVITGTLTALGAISGSSNLLIGGTITAANELLNGNLIVSGSTFLGDSAADRLFVTASAFFAQPVVMNGNQISGSSGGNITLQSGGDVVIAGDLELDGNDIKASDGISTISLSGRDVTVAGDLQVSGNDIKSSTGATVITLSANDATFADRVDVLGAMAVTGSLSSLGVISGSSNLLIGGSSTVAGNSVVTGALSALGAISGSSNLLIGGNSTIAGNEVISGTLQVVGDISGSTARFSSLTQPGVVIAGAGGLLTTTASLFYDQNRLEVSSSVRVSGDLAVNGEGGVADITSNALTAAIFDAGVNTIYMGNDAELIQMGEQGGLVDFAGDVRLTGSIAIAGTSAEFIDRIDGGTLTMRAGDLSAGAGKVTVKLSGSTLGFGDGWMSAGGWSDGDLSLADSSTDWQRFRNIFGEASILSAIATAAALPTDAKFMYKILSATGSISGDIVRQVGGAHFSASYMAVPNASRNENVDLFLNGQLLVSKSYDAVNYDYDVKPDGSWIDFNFELQPDDFISILVPQTVASVAEYVQSSGVGGGGGGGATNLDGLTDVVITSAASNQVLTYNGTNWVNSAPQGGETLVGTYTSTYTLRATTSDGTATELTTDGASPTASNVIVLANNSTSVFDITVVGRRTDADGEGASYEVKVTLDRNANAASTALVGSGYKLIIAEDSSGWDVGIAANTTDGALRVTATGQAGKTIKWTAFVREVKSVE